MKTIYLIMGRTSSGKTSVTRQVCENLNLKLLSSYTTRPIRANEVEGIDHLFIDKSEVDKYKKDVIAHTIINGNEYFATKSQLLDSDAYIIDYKGLKYLRNLAIPDVKFVTIYFSMPKDFALKLALLRGDTEHVFEERYNSENKQFAELEIKHDFDYLVINNNTFESAVQQLTEIIMTGTKGA